MSKMNLANWIDCTEVEGPGKRFTLWVQGCQRCCSGCCNPQFLDFVPKNIIDNIEISKMIEKSVAKNGIEGVTFLGGEPMLQAKGLSEIAKRCKFIGLSVMIFTGYILDDLIANHIPHVNELLQYTDLLVDGAYEKNKPETIRNWVG
ncbi:MAG: radical SAM protein, partial [Planctomycetaceae bacterium]|nr:radical SAM protein [Planctomycetaceae bacterium]